jgi:hypothetical protein
MRRTLPIVILIAISVAGCGSHKGAISPNAGLADFNKYGEAYYLDVAQVPIGSTEEKVRAEYGDKYEVVESKQVDGKLIERWKFTSYRATFARDPIDKYMFVTLADRRVTNVDEMLVGRSGQPVQQAQPKMDTYEQLEKLKQLHDAKVITAEEYEAKRKLLLDQIR